mmetsp:Transcript_37011/g.86725  ORF Transcript_37011/g.86725 Transcript_37011/m.86725 type:complete len:207 (-) Transcript_37011:288-908(-)
MRLHRGEHVVRRLAGRCGASLRRWGVVVCGERGPTATDEDWHRPPPVQDQHRVLALARADRVAKQLLLVLPFPLPRRDLRARHRAPDNHLHHRHHGPHHRRHPGGLRRAPHPRAALRGAPRHFRQRNVHYIRHLPGSGKKDARPRPPDACREALHRLPHVVAAHDLHLHPHHRHQPCHGRGQLQPRGPPHHVPPLRLGQERVLGSG